mmetsp:Transcript_29032/g.47954  ORF Transcript_29032/g.47954 Transcript_29032/m.47954 type:complete len:475 (-) Transcript_29032:35-1459(-)|eukprot:CAMPEP_0119009540 /NCGR_PEP_ID=MMETSP1176-20130426/4435_1 /TAXON_ID=265551 /ORGANISM="Synedropsis recta cf, Strain CCMP1620" /LENGTH=474 /DNA_ID=CAMNT_0006962077 /DNA_START=84 /DNA_END=1508 /DNA_ORIENTATION=+
MSAQVLTSTTAPGTIFNSRAELAEHYKSDWHKYNLKRREAGLVLLQKADFQARLEAAKAMREEREGRSERTGKDHLKSGNKRKEKKNKGGVGEKLGGGAKAVSQASAYDQIKKNNAISSDEKKDESMEDAAAAPGDVTPEVVAVEEEPPVIEPRQCLFDKHFSPTLTANLERMHRKYGFFVPDQEYLVDAEGLLGYCHEKVKLGHTCLYCQRIFTTWHGCQKHMISTEHTKLRYERGVDLEEYDPFFDFSEANEEFLRANAAAAAAMDEEESGVVTEDGDEEDGWEDVTDDEAEEGDDEDMYDDEEGADDMYAGYKDEIARFGFDVTPLGELVFPDGRIVGHRGLARYYKQRIAPATSDRASVRAARRAAGESLYKGRVYEEEEGQHMSSLAMARAGLQQGSGGAGGSGKGVLVASGGGFTALSLYRYRAVIKKARKFEKQGQRLRNRTQCNMNKMDKKGNRILNDVSVAWAKR